MQPHPLDLRDLRTSASGSKLDEILTKLIASRSITKEVETIVEKRLADGYVPKTTLLIDLIKLTRNMQFYGPIRIRLKYCGSEHLLALYNDSFQDPEIESTLVERLYKGSLDPMNADRRYITRSLISHGSLASLATLETIEGELRDHANAARNFGSRLPFPDNIAAESDAQFYDLIVKAIEAVRLRAATPAEPLPTGPKESDPTVPINVRKHIESAKKHRSNDPAMCANPLRKCAESIISYILSNLNEEEKFVSKDRNPTFRSKVDYLGNLGKRERSGHLSPIVSHLTALKRLGDWGSHEHEWDGQVHDEPDPLTSKEVESYIGLCEELVDRTEKWVKVRSRD